MNDKRDEELAREVQQGNISAFELLVKRYQRRLFSFVYRYLRNHEDTQDVVQDALVKVYVSIEKFDLSRKFSTYIFEIAKNTAISKLRQARKTLPLEGTEEAEGDEKIYERLSKSEDSARVKAALAGLAGKYRQMIDLYYFKDLSYEEIGKKLHLPLTTVRIRLHRAKQQLRSKLTYEAS